MSTAAQAEFDALIDNNENRPIIHLEDAENHSDRSDSVSSTQDRHPAHSSDDEEKRSNRASPTMPSAVYHIPSGTHFDANTGPKGVIADAKSYDRARKRSFRQTIYALSNGISGNVFHDKQKPAPTREKSSSPEVSGDDDEDAFVQKWRAERLSELQSGGHDHRTRRLSPSKRRYGRVATVDANGYLDAIEKVSPETIVVVMISDEQSTISGIVEDTVSTLARKHEFTRFVKISYEEVEMDPIAAPAILAYKAGDLIANLVSVIDEIPAGRDLSASSLEALLKQRKVLF